MDFKTALAKVRGVEGVDQDAIAALEQAFEAVDGKRFELLGEKKTAQQRLQTVEGALTSTAKLLGIEGTPDEVLEQTEPKLRALVDEAAQLRESKTSLEERATTAEGKVTTFERKDRISTIATTANANPVVLEKLLGDRLDELKIEGEGDERIVKLGKSPLKEAIAADESLSAFSSALFPAVEKPKDEKPAPPRIPGGSPNGKTGGDGSKSYVNKTYRGIRSLAK
ncbi:MAG: hypothetical protein AAFX78_04895 [Cyanobacteria bacterium J06638_20]